ncbi:MAG: ATP-binding protein [Planctomycetota bacterium]|nr:ATP-binding protein [Planctomycetota bacterium]
MTEQGIEVGALQDVLRQRRNLVVIEATRGSLIRQMGWRITPDLVATTHLNPAGRRLTVRQVEEAGGLGAPQGVSVFHVGRLVLLELEPRPSGSERGRWSRRPPRLRLAGATKETFLAGSVVWFVTDPTGVTRLTLGVVQGGSHEELEYLAPDMPGSIGSPLFDAWGAVLGMHEGRGRRSGREDGSVGVLLGALLERLREVDRSLWEQIARAHHFVDQDLVRRRWAEQAASPAHDEVRPQRVRRELHRRVATLWQFDPTRLHHVDHEDPVGLLVQDVEAEVPVRDVTTLLADVPGPRWSLRDGPRRKALRAMGDLAELRVARQENAALAVDHSGQRLFDRVLSGERLDLTRLSPLELHRLRTIAGWLEDVPGVELSVPDVERARGDQRLLEPLRHLVGDHFAGRAAELALLVRFMADPGARVLCLQGPGGLGKSSLLAKLGLELHLQGCPFANVDFDRASVALTDRASVLSEIERQLGSQRPIETTSRDVVERVVARLKGERRALLVLDTLEEGPFTGEDDAPLLVNLLRPLCEAVPNLRVVLAGRVVPFQLDGLPEPAHLPLQGLDKAAALALLARFGVKDPAIGEALFRVCEGNPLSLRLCADGIVRRRWEPDQVLQRIGELRQQELVQGYLYQRILHHIRGKDPRVEKIAHPGLALRKITPELIREVLVPAGTLELDDPDEAEDLYQELKQVSSLVHEHDGALWHRSDLRRATLRLIHEDQPEKTRAVHERAVEFYARREGVADRAEELYHRLSLGQPRQVLDERWIRGVEPHLLGALEELQGDARAYIAGRLGGTDQAVDWSQAPIEDWEQEVARRAERLLENDTPLQAVSVMRRRAERSPRSPLPVLEARAYLKAGLAEQALQAAESALATPRELDLPGRRLELHQLGAAAAMRIEDHEAADRHLRAAESLGGTLEQVVARTVRAELERDAEAEAELTDVLVRGGVTPSLEDIELDREFVVDTRRPAWRRWLSQKAEVDLARLPSDVARVAKELVVRLKAAGERSQSLLDDAAQSFLQLDPKTLAEQRPIAQQVVLTLGEQRPEALAYGLAAKTVPVDVDVVADVVMEHGRVDEFLGVYGSPLDRTPEVTIDATVRRVLKNLEREGHLQQALGKWVERDNELAEPLARALRQGAEPDLARLLGAPLGPIKGIGQVELGGFGMGL